MELALPKKVVILIVIIILLLSGLGLLWWNLRAERVTDLPPFVSGDKTDMPLVAVLATKLEIPWSLDFLPDGSMIFTERQGRIRLFDAQKGLLPPWLTIEEVAHRGEGGLLGVAVHPDFSKNGFVYVYYTYQKDASLANRVIRLTKKGNQLLDRKIIIDGIPGASIHDGGRIKFGPDNLIYVTTGDAAVPELAQDRSSLAGKILRLKDDGTVPNDNPFPGSLVYSYGHRNPQGLAWDDKGRLWATEHGSSGTDELNLIVPGRNYGWPTVRGDQRTSGLESPIIHSGGDTWAPSGAAFLNGSIFFAGLRGQSLFEAAVKDQTVTLRRHFVKNFGRLRDVVVGPDNFFYLITSNRDGRAVPAAEDDQLIRINPAKL